MRMEVRLARGNAGRSPVCPIPAAARPIISSHDRIRRRPREQKIVIIARSQVLPSDTFAELVKE